MSGNIRSRSAQFQSTDNTVIWAARIALAAALRRDLSLQDYMAEVHRSSTSIRYYADHDMAMVKYNGHRILVAFHGRPIFKNLSAVVGEDRHGNVHDAPFKMSFDLDENGWDVLQVHQYLDTESRFYLQHAVTWAFGAKRALGIVQYLKEIPVVRQAARLRGDDPNEPDETVVTYYFDPKCEIEAVSVCWLLSEMAADASRVVIRTKNGNYNYRCEDGELTI